MTATLLIGCSGDASGPGDDVTGRMTYSVGGSSSCFADASGELYCWGYIDNPDGQTAPVSTPRRMSVNGNVTAVSARSSFICVIAQSKVQCRGSAGLDKLGRPTDLRFYDSFEPIESSENFDSISTAHGTGCALSRGRRVHCWGFNGTGNSGIGTTSDMERPKPVAGDIEFKSITVGDVGVCALTPDGRTFCWGGIVNGGPTRLVPTHIPAPTFTKISSGDRNICGLATDGRAYCWGYSIYGTLGPDHVGTNDWVDAPVLINHAKPFKDIAAGLDIICAITSDNELHCWGNGYYGFFGSGGVPATPIPQRISFPATPGSLPQRLTTHACAASTASDVYCWGANGAGQTGSVPTSCNTHPAQQIVCSTAPRRVEF